MQRLVFNKLKQIKYLFTLLLNNVIILVIGVDEAFLKRYITDLMIKGFSLNQIQENLELIFNIRISHSQIRKIEQESAEKAKKANLRIDKKIAPKISKIEVDEIFQGKDSVTMGAISKKYNYCVALQWCIDRTKESITAFLEPIAKRFMNLKIVITDLYSGYKDIIPKLFKKAVHLCCHIHAGRILYREFRHIKANLTRIKKKKDKNLKDKKKKNGILNKKRDRIRFLSNRIKRDENTIKQLTVRNKKKSKVHTKTIDAHLQKVKYRVNKDKKELKQLLNECKGLIKEVRKISALEKEIKKQITKSNQDLLQSGRLLKEFTDLLKNFSIEFEIKKEKFLKRLENSKYSLAHKILKLIQDNPDLFSVRKKQILKANYQNTNTIEGLFSLFRRLLDSTRLLPSESGSNRYCDLFRLYHNTMAPFTGPNRDKSPAERLGVKLSGKSYLDLIYPVRNRKTHFFYGSSNIKIKTSMGLNGNIKSNVKIL